MEVLDPRLGLFAAGTALVGSERARKAVGQGVGHAAAAVMMVGGPIVRPIANAGQDIVEEARQTAGRSGTKRGSRTKSSGRS